MSLSVRVPTVARGVGIVTVALLAAGCGTSAGHKHHHATTTTTPPSSVASTTTVPSTPTTVKLPPVPGNPGGVATTVNAQLTQIDNLVTAAEATAAAPHAAAPGVESPAAPQYLQALNLANEVVASLSTLSTQLQPFSASLAHDGLQVGFISDISELTSATATAKTDLTGQSTNLVSANKATFSLGVQGLRQARTALGQAADALNAFVAAHP